MKRIVLPIEEHGALSPLFEESTFFELFTLKNQKIVEDQFVSHPTMNECELVQWFVKLKITDVIGYKISEEMIKNLNQNKINVFVGVEFKTPQCLVHDLIEGNLKTNGKVIELE